MVGGARRGARLGGASLDSTLPKETIELLGLEATKTRARRGALAIADRHRRAAADQGSLALSLCHLAAGRVDAVASLRPVRSVDIAAAQLLVRERGLAVELFDDPPLVAAPLDLVPRSRIAAAGRLRCARIAAALE